MNLLSIILIAFKRLWSNKGLTVCLIIGLISSVALMSSIPLYADAANFKVLKDELSAADEGRPRPPFAFMYRYIGAWHGSIDMEDFDPVNEYIQNSVPGVIDLPVTSTARYVKSDNFSLFPVSEAAYIGIRQPLGWVSLGFVDDFYSHINLIEGTLPQQATGDTETIEVLVSQEMAEETGLQPGEEYIAFRQAATVTAEDGTTEETEAVQFTVRVAGIWAPIDDTDSYWFYSPKSLASNLAVSEESFRTRIAPSMEDEIYAAVWYIIFDGDAIRTDDVPELLGRINLANTRVASLLANTVLDISPMEELEDYRYTTFVMTIVLYVFSVPILGLVLYFVGLISGLVVERQRGEIAILKSRGTGDSQVIGIYALQGLVVGIIGLAGGLLLGKQLAVIMGNTVSFLAFGQRHPLPVVITPRALRFALVGVAIGFLATLTPAMRAARLTIVTYKRDRARALEKPFWQRYFIDFILLIPAGYGYYMLRNRGTIAFLGDQVGGNPFQDPLLFLVPSITIVALSLLLVRVFPLIMEGLAWITGQVVRSVSVVLAFRQLARVSKQYTGSLLLLVLTLSLATFTASMARTLDQSLKDSWYYRYGGDYALIESGENTEIVTEDGGSGDSTALEGDFQGWAFVPVSEHLKVDGVTGATRVGSYPAEVYMAKASGRGEFFGIDRVDFPKIAFFRNDFSRHNLGELMNRLAKDESAVLVNPSFLSAFTLKVGDKVPITISAYGERKEIEFTIADTISYFPTWYPDKDNDIDYLIVGNLDYVFEQLGGEYPYDVWITTEPGADIDRITGDLSDLDINVVSAYGAEAGIEKEQAAPERTGVFGILSVGFVAAAFLTVLGFLLHTYISFRQRYIEFGVMRAIGLSVGQMISFLGIEQLLLIITGITSGTALGIWVSRLFIPFLQVGTTENADIPPFVVLIAWSDIMRIYIVFGIMLFAAVGSMIYFLLHLRIFEAVKLGEAV